MIRRVQQNTNKRKPHHNKFRDISRRYMFPVPGISNEAVQELNSVPVNKLRSLSTRPTRTSPEAGSRDHKTVRFQNGFNKVVIELSGVQFWSEIILVLSNRIALRARSNLKSRV